MIDKLQFISHQTDEVSHLESIRIALDAGCTWIQLRIKNQPEKHVCEIAHQAKNLCDQYGAKLVINDFPSVAREVNAYGLHLGLQDMTISEARKITGQDIIIGGTANTLKDVRQRIEEGANYIGLGPYRYTSTKKNLSPVLGLDGYRAILTNQAIQNKQVPVIAIGGITDVDIDGLVSIGVHGVAVSSFIIQAENPEQLISKIQKALC